MNTKLLSGILLAGGLLVGGAASAGTFTWTGSVADWAKSSLYDSRSSRVVFKPIIPAGVAGMMGYMEPSMALDTRSGRV